MDIAVVTTKLVEHDAQGNWTAATIKTLRDMGHTVHLYAFAHNRKDVEVDGFLGRVNEHSLKSNLRAMLDAGEIARVLARHDLIVAVGPDIGAHAAINHALRMVPDLQLVWIYHGMTPAAFLSWKDGLMARARLSCYMASMRRARKVIVDSYSVADELAARGLFPDRVEVCRLGIDVRRFQGGDRSKVRGLFGFRDDVMVGLYVGRVHRAKNLDTLVSAVHFVPGMFLLVVGRGPDEARLLTLTSGDCEGCRRIVWIGRVPDEELPDYYAACDFFVTASDHEGFCVPIVEAMAAGKPAIVPDRCSMPEIAGDAALVYNEFPVAAIEKLIADPILRHDLGRRAVARAQGFEATKALKNRATSILEAVGR